MKTPSFLKTFNKKCTNTEKIFLGLLFVCLGILFTKLFLFNTLTPLLFLHTITLSIVFVILFFLAYYDYIKTEIHNFVSLSLLLFLLGINLVLPLAGKMEQGVFITDSFHYVPYNNLIAALILGILFTLIVVISKEKAMGQGDIRIAIIVGLIIGSVNLLPWSYITIFSALLFGSILAIKARKIKGLKIPFAPFMVLGCLVVILWNL